MEEYTLHYQWVCEADWQLQRSYRSDNFGPCGKEWFLSYTSKDGTCSVELHREDISKSVQIKGFLQIRSKRSRYMQEALNVNFTVNAGVIRTTIAKVDRVTAIMYGIINVTCAVFITNIIEFEEKSLQSDAEYTWHTNVQKLPKLDDTKELSSTLSIKSLSNLSRDMQVMYDRHDFSDFVLVRNNSEFHAHRCVLSARSPVFARMFQCAMSEITDNRMLIADIDADILEKLLLFMYSGQANPSSYSQARDLYYAADKYAVHDLKHICGEFIPSFLSSSTALETLILSDRYQDDDLMNKAITFIASVFEEIKSTEAWNIFLKENSALGTKVLSFVVEQLYKKLDAA
ncbi:speckle-type POZ protein-like [Stegodyphus dumicola]|uniref:speckle-type POZ protein-like n=1 Tax=Stegodyphus dumicola TaxID=202533 RepID=UPI0015B2DBC7|nr:speckle-type POZ protein-like [Stegodyphus dumicola]